MAASKFHCGKQLTATHSHFDATCAKIRAFYFDLDNTLIPTQSRRFQGDQKGELC
ncbi:GM19534 [Drosophila sechellia]|uniref:GM19534 n=1 Tax=Drosophila sechellia TaxID=7238 RepID=B4I0K1_DROSE|nr:GM19534 [Drosophila sechellia]